MKSLIRATQSYCRRDLLLYRLRDVDRLKIITNLTKKPFLTLHSVADNFADNKTPLMVTLRCETMS